MIFDVSNERVKRLTKNINTIINNPDVSPDNHPFLFSLTLDRIPRMKNRISPIIKVDILIALLLFEIMLKYKRRV